MTNLLSDESISLAAFGKEWPEKANQKEAKASS